MLSSKEIINKIILIIIQKEFFSKITDKLKIYTNVVAGLILKNSFF